MLVFRRECPLLLYGAIRHGQDAKALRAQILVDLVRAFDRPGVKRPDLTAFFVGLTDARGFLPARLS